MQLTDTCIDCLLSRVAFECDLTSANPKTRERAMRECQEDLESLRSSSLLHPQIASRVHRKACSICGNTDPFYDLKRVGNNQALEVCKKVSPNLATFRDRVIASVLGNTFDYAVKDHTVTSNFSNFFAEEFPKGLDRDETDKILLRAQRVVYLTDNCGEIVFDHLLVKYLKDIGAQVTVAVRDGPILNDATMEDALALGFDRIADHLTTTGGGSEIGLDLDKMPADLAEAIDSCSIIISKGMANYESLSEYSGLPPVAYLMCVKCQVIADDIGLPRGSKIAMLKR